MCILSIKVPIRKKSGNLFNDPRTYIQLYMDTGCSLEDLPAAMDDRDGWQEKIKYLFTIRLI